MYEGTASATTAVQREHDAGVDRMPQFIEAQPTSARNDGWESIIGGQVYRGTCFPDLVGTLLLHRLHRRARS